MLNAKEAFWLKEQDIVRKNKMPLITFKFNIPTIPKNSPPISQAFIKALKDFLQFLGKINDNFTIIEQSENVLGPYALILIKFNSKLLKKKAIKFENEHKIGRLFDIDIMDELGRVLNRTKKRKCFLCDNPAIICMRLNKHSQNEVRSFFDEKIKSYLE